jgi:hypothetical protein
VDGLENLPPPGFEPRTVQSVVGGGGGSKNEGKETINKSNKVEGKEFWGLSPPAGSYTLCNPSMSKKLFRLDLSERHTRN